MKTFMNHLNLHQMEIMVVELTEADMMEEGEEEMLEAEEVVLEI